MLCNGEFLFIDSVFSSKLQLYTLVSQVCVLIGIGTYVWAVLVKEALVKLQGLYTS
jgi:hypothetical protein